MAIDRYYLSVSKEKRQPQNDGRVAVISLGSPQRGDAESACTVCDVEIVQNMKEAKRWFRRQLATKPWLKN